MGLGIDVSQNQENLSRESAYRLISLTDENLNELCETAASIRERGKSNIVSFSPKVFIPLTRLCRDFCNYCTFRQSPAEASCIYMSPEDVFEVVKAGEKLGVTEALITLGERPEIRYPEAREWLKHRGYKNTIEYVASICQLIISETSLLPHANPGTMSLNEMSSLKDGNASMGLMLENISDRLCEPGNPHESAPSKRPRVRLNTLKFAGELKIPFTTGILIGIGETREERIDSLFAIRDLHDQYGHIQEVIIQNFRAKPDTAMEHAPEPDTDDVLWTVAVARLILGPVMNIQVPPNLSSEDYDKYLDAGINDWGGISPLTIDFVNPEAPWPQIDELAEKTAAKGFELKPRLPVYPEYIENENEYLPDSLTEQIDKMSDEFGFSKGGLAQYVS